MSNGNPRQLGKAEHEHCLTWIRLLVRFAEHDEEMHHDDICQLTGWNRSTFAKARHNAVNFGYLRAAGIAVVFPYGPHMGVYSARSKALNGAATIDLSNNQKIWQLRNVRTRQITTIHHTEVTQIAYKGQLRKRMRELVDMQRGTVAHLNGSLRLLGFEPEDASI